MPDKKEKKSAIHKMAPAMTNLTIFIESLIAFLIRVLIPFQAQGNHLELRFSRP